MCFRFCRDKETERQFFADNSAGWAGPLLEPTCCLDDQLDLNRAGLDEAGGDEDLVYCMQVEKLQEYIKADRGRWAGEVYGCS